MKAWFLTLTQRERYLLIGGSSFLLLLLLIFGIWQPLQQYTQRTQAALSTSQEDHTILLATGEEIKSLRNIEERPTQDTETSVQVLIAPLLQRHELSLEQARTQDRGTNGVNLRLEEVPFDRLISFLGDLEAQYGVYATTITLIPTDTPGLTGAQLNLER